MLVCTACKNKSPCTCTENEIRAYACKDPEDLHLIWSVWHEYIPGDELYIDPQGEPYKGLTNFIRTPIPDPTCTACKKGWDECKERSPPNPAEQIYTEAQKKHKLCTEK